MSRKDLLSRAGVVAVLLGLLSALLVMRAPVQASAADDDQSKQTKRPDVIYVPTPQEVVDKMLEMAEVKKDDIVYDLGCGDGRIVVTAAKKFGCRAGTRPEARIALISLPNSSQSPFRAQYSGQMPKRSRARITRRCRRS